MFGKSNKAHGASDKSTAKVAQKTTQNNVAPSIISEGLHVVGNLTSDGEVHIDGIVNGDILAAQLTVGTNAQITGHIEADNALIRGTVNGIIQAKSVTLAETARVVGDVIHEDLAIENGAQMEGHCRRRSKEEAAAPQSTSVSGKASKQDATASGPVATPA